MAWRSGGARYDGRQYLACGFVGGGIRYRFGLAPATGVSGLLCPDNPRDHLSTEI